MSAPAPHSLTVGELAGMLAGMDPAAFSNVVALRRKAGALVQYECELFDMVEDARERLEDLRHDLRRTEIKQEAARLDLKAIEKRVQRMRRALAGIAKLKASKRLPLP